ncbi:MAG: AmmeMemoRadiSam system radical SAM enzyme, partial [Anaerolineales bacterium]
LRRARRRALAAGMQYVYTGNLVDRRGSSTYCPGCGHAVIGRIGYRITEYQLDHLGCCRFCHQPIPGVYAGDR